MSVCPSIPFSIQLALGRSSPATKSQFMATGHLRGAGQGAQGKVGHSPATKMRAGGLLGFPARETVPVTPKRAHPLLHCPFLAAGIGPAFPSTRTPCQEDRSGKAGESGAMPRGKKSSTQPPRKPHCPSSSKGSFSASSLPALGIAHRGSEGHRGLQRPS